MDSNSTNVPVLLKYLIFNSSYPFVIKNYVKWEVLSWSLEDWKRVLGHEKLMEYRVGKKEFTKHPQWERKTATELVNFEEFLKSSELHTNKWMYFDYKSLKQWFNEEELRKNFDWGVFGLSELSFEDGKIWIGSEGAHTPCHSDTYGCNLVVQVYGRKEWLLFPSNENLKPTRIPYEESSIYSSLNFYSPNVDDFKGDYIIKQVILEPGDALFVPHKWWHYVENLDIAISVNLWVPLPIDDKERMKESLVQMFIRRITDCVETRLKEEILNPNEDMENMSFEDSMKIIKKCKAVILNPCKEKSVTFTDDLSVEQLFQKLPFLRKVPEITQEQFLIFLQTQSSRFSYTNANDIEEDENEDLFKLINAYTNDDTVSFIMNKFLM